jgi:hypothetical protein
MSRRSWKRKSFREPNRTLKEDKNMKYSNINELDQRIEKIISQTVKHYYTDWKNYDRPKYMGLKGSDKKEDKKVILIARSCGTYLVRIEDIKNNDNWAITIYEYYQTQEHATYYYININSYEVKKIDPAAFNIKAA